MVAAFSKRWRRELCITALVLFDGAAVFGSFALAYWLRFRSPAFEPASDPGFTLYAQAAAVVALAWVAIFTRFDLYRTRQTWRGLDLLFAAAAAVSLGMTFFLALSYLRHIFVYSRLVIMATWVGNIVATVAVRLALKHALVACHRHGIGVRRLVVVGENVAAHELIRALALHPQLGYVVAGLLRPRAGDPGAAMAAVGPMWEGPARVADELARRAIDDVVIAMPVGGNGELREFIAVCQEHGMRVRLVPDVYHLYSPHVQLAAVETVPLLAFRDGATTADGLVKRLLDVTLAGGALVLAAPLLAAAAVAVRRATGGRAFRRVPLVGRHGATFGRLAFARPAPRRPGGGGREPVGWSVVLGHPVTAALPALVNVLRGDMSLVGPRAHPAGEARRWNHWERRRLLARPGLTGLAQLELRRIAGTAEIETDLRYVEQQSVALDLKILLRSGWAVARGRARIRPAAPARAAESGASPRLAAVG
jgi:lipopolysaccharide/colanic/teichoic acid biosynthesis glycosyltransferase